MSRCVSWLFVQLCFYVLLTVDTFIGTVQHELVQITGPPHKGSIQLPFKTAHLLILVQMN